MSPLTIDDLFICAKAENIDRAGANGVNIIGYGKPELGATPSLLPSLGAMRFDLADIQPRFRMALLKVSL